MLRKLLAVIITIGLLAGTSVSAQEDSTVKTWYFAMMQGTVAAYTAEGEMNTLLEAEKIGSGTRLGPQTALLEVTVGGATAIYKLTPEAAEPLDFDFDFEELEHPPEASLALASPDGTHAVIFSSYTFAPAVLIDLETNTGELLTDLILHPQNCCRFSADGAYFRYPSGQPNSDATWTLWEHDLAAGQERAIHEYTRAVPLMPDRYGEYWLYSLGLNADTQTWSYILVHADGTAETFDEFPANQEHIIYWTIIGDETVTYNAACTADCTVEVYPLPEGEPAVFSMPSTEENVTPLYRGENGLLVWFQMAELWFLSDDGEAEQVGFSPQAGTHYPRGERWVVVTDAPDSTNFKVWDNLTQTFVMESETVGDYMYLDLHNRETGFLLADLSTNEAPTYLYREEAVVELPPGRYFELLADGTVLGWSQMGIEGKTGPGIFRYDPGPGEYTMLVEGMFPLPLQDAQ